MKSRISIDFAGIDKMPSGNQFEPVIRVAIEDSEDVRDGLVKAFFETLGGESNWLRADFAINTSYGKTRTDVTIIAIPPSDFEDTIKAIESRLPTKIYQSNTFGSRFGIGDKVKYNKKFGKVIAVGFTESKVFYAVEDLETGQEYKGIDSEHISEYHNE